MAFGLVKEGPGAFQFLGKEGFSLPEPRQIMVCLIKGGLDGVSPHAFLLDSFLGCFFSKFPSFSGRLLQHGTDSYIMIT